jgi:hypothetical protein
LFLSVYLLTHTDFRDSAEPEATLALEPVAGSWQFPGLLRWPWSLLGLLPTIAAMISCRWLLAMRTRWLAASGLLIAMIAALTHQFGAAMLVILLLLLSGHLGWRELTTRKALPYVATIILSLVCWTAFASAVPEWLAQIETPWQGGSRWIALGYEFLRFPDIPTEVIWPWARAVPQLGLGISLLLTGAALRVITDVDDKHSTIRILLFIIVCMVALTGAIGPPRHETRYVFFLFPAVIVVTLAAIAWGVRAIARRPHIAAILTVVSASTAFVLSEDFSLTHLINVDEEKTNFRVGIPNALAGHWVSRADVRSAAQWLAGNAQSPHDLTVNGVPSVDFYYPNFNFTYVDHSHQRFAAYACTQGTRERWGNRPLLSSVSSLKDQIATHRRTFLVVYIRDVINFSGPLVDWSPRVSWTSVDGDILILSLSPLSTDRSKQANDAPGGAA